MIFLNLNEGKILLELTKNENRLRNIFRMDSKSHILLQSTSPQILHVRNRFSFFLTIYYFACTIKAKYPIYIINLFCLLASNCFLLTNIMKLGNWFRYLFMSFSDCIWDSHFVVFELFICNLNVLVFVISWKMSNANFYTNFIICSAVSRKFYYLNYFVVDLIRSLINSKVRNDNPKMIHS